MLFGNFFRPKTPSISSSYDRHNVNLASISPDLVTAARNALPDQVTPGTTADRSIQVPGIGFVKIQFEWDDAGKTSGEWKFVKATRAGTNDPFSTPVHFEKIGKSGDSQANTSVSS